MIAREFATPIGIAEMNVLNNAKRGSPLNAVTYNEIESKEGRARFKETNEEVRVNSIVRDSIKKHKYKMLMRRIFKLKKLNPNWTDRRIYSTAWRIITTTATTNNKGSIAKSNKQSTLVA